MVTELKTKNGGKNQEYQPCCPLPSVVNVKVVLRHFHQCCYRSSPLWFFY
jgi:hypothetical protein